MIMGCCRNRSVPEVALERTGGPSVPQPAQALPDVLQIRQQPSKDPPWRIACREALQRIKEERNNGATNG